MRVIVPPHIPEIPEGATGEVREAALTYAYGIVFDGMEQMGIHLWYVESQLAPEEGPFPSTLGAAPAFPVGFRVRLTVAPHIPGQSAGLVREARLTYAYGILFDAMEEEGIHEWFVEAELAAGNDPR